MIVEDATCTATHKQLILAPITSNLFFSWPNSISTKREPFLANDTAID